MAKGEGFLRCTRRIERLYFYDISIVYINYCNNKNKTEWRNAY